MKLFSELFTNKIFDILLSLFQVSSHYLSAKPFPFNFLVQIWSVFIEIGIYNFGPFLKVNSIQEASAKCFAVHFLEFEISQTLHIKTQNSKHQNVKSIGEKLTTKGLMFFVSFFTCDLQGFKSYYVNHKAFGASFLYWVYFSFCDITIFTCNLIVSF